MDFLLSCVGQVISEDRGAAAAKAAAAEGAPITSTPAAESVAVSSPKNGTEARGNMIIMTCQYIQPIFFCNSLTKFGRGWTVLAEKHIFCNWIWNYSTLTHILCGYIFVLPSVFRIVELTPESLPDRAGCQAAPQRWLRQTATSSTSQSFRFSSFYFLYTSLSWIW